jgi:hypothetical protein
MPQSQVSRVCRQGGQGMTEYALILSLIAVVGAVALTPFGNDLLAYLRMIAVTL